MSINTRGGVIHQDAFPAKVIDTTGAGDAFTAGYLAGLAKGYADGRKGLEAGARWAALMVTVEASVPPNWSTVPGSHNFFKRGLKLDLTPLAVEVSIL